MQRRQPQKGRLTSFVRFWTEQQYPKIFFKTKRAMQNSLFPNVDSNCSARDDVSLAGRVKIFAKARHVENLRIH